MLFAYYAAPAAWHLVAAHSAAALDGNSGAALNGQSLRRCLLHCAGASMLWQRSSIQWQQRGSTEWAVAQALILAGRGRGRAVVAALSDGSQIMLGLLALIKRVKKGQPIAAGRGRGRAVAVAVVVFTGSQVRLGFLALFKG